MPVIEYEPFEQHKQVMGVFVEGCVDRGDGSRFRHQAHSHTSGHNKGWICVLSWRRLYNQDGKASALMLHELAHILSGDGHTDKWRKQLRELGGQVRYWETKEYTQLRRMGVRVYSSTSLKEAKRRFLTKERMAQNKYIPL